MILRTSPGICKHVPHVWESTVTVAVVLRPCLSFYLLSTKLVRGKGVHYLTEVCIAQLIWPLRFHENKNLHFLHALCHFLLVSIGRARPANKTWFPTNSLGWSCSQKATVSQVNSSPVLHKPLFSCPQAGQMVVLPWKGALGTFWPILLTLKH